MKKKWLGGILFGVLAIGILRQLWDEVGSSRRTLKVPSSSRSEKPVARGNSIEILTQQEEELPIGNHSTITSDIVKIWHNVDSKAICVELKRDARCPHPAFLGRLSGPALAILEWNERQFDDNNGTILCGGYGHYWLDAGDYFVDILIIHCADFGVNALKRNGNKTAWLEADHKFDCVEDPDHNRITTNEEGQQPVIHIPASIEGRDSYRFGRWIRKPNFPSHPLQHRYQPTLCMHPRKYPVGTRKRTYCTSRMERDSDGSNGTEITGLYEYEFQWSIKVLEDEIIEKIRQRQDEKGKTTPKICAVGDSHSRYMSWKSCTNLGLRGLFAYVKSPWISPDGIVKRIEGRNCDIFFIQVGQWPVSKHAKQDPYSFGKYHDELKQHVHNILGYNPDAMIYLLTIDQGPLMAGVNSCEEWRTPTYLDGFSYVNQMIVQELNMPTQVKYVDTNFIIYSFFDGHEDWQHLLEVVRSRKTLYMAAIMLGELENWQD